MLGLVIMMHILQKKNEHEFSLRNDQRSLRQRFCFPSRGCSRFICRGTIVFLFLLLAGGALDSRRLIADEGLDNYNVAVGLFKQNRWNQAADQFRKFLKNHEKHENCKPLPDDRHDSARSLFQR